LYTDDPNKNPNARLIREVTEIDDSILSMAKNSSGSDVGTGGMATKLTAAKIATFSGADMVIANGRDVRVIYDVFQGDFVGTLFHANPDPAFQLEDLLQ
jgi:glutamate 5-kinase